MLYERSDDGDTRGTQEFLEFVELGRRYLRRNAHRALAGALRLHFASFPSRSIAVINRSSGVVSEIRKNPSPFGP